MTAYEMRISDWSADVCPSDLGLGLLALVPSPTTTPSERATCQTRPMTTRHCLVTGANRGVGLEFVRQLLARGDRVVATCRQPGRATALNALAGDHPGRLPVLPLDVADPKSHAALAARSEARRVGKEWVSTCRSRWSTSQ